ncbi:ribosomal protein L4 [Peniophora sp. CONT]|nr:ribosomal protein L4 [Peniophora sp. CONT]
MLSLARRALGECSRLPARRFATAVTNAPPSTAADTLLTLPSSATAPVKYSPLQPPVYLAVTPLVKPEPGAEEQVAELDPTVFAHPIRRDILHLCVVHHRDGERQGSANTKTRSEINGSGHKLRPQKGSGRARLGDRSSPMLRGGATAFGPRPRDFSTKLPRKVIEMGMRVALSARLREHALRIVPSFEWTDFKTRGLLERLEELKWSDRTLFVSGKEEVPLNLLLASGNIQHVETMTVKEFNVYEAVRWRSIVLDMEAVQYFEDKLSKLHREATP